MTQHSPSSPTWQTSNFLTKSTSSPSYRNGPAVPSPSAPTTVSFFLTLTDSHASLSLSPALASPVPERTLPVEQVQFHAWSTHNANCTKPSPYITPQIVHHRCFTYTHYVSPHKCPVKEAMTPIFQMGKSKPVRLSKLFTSQSQKVVKQGFKLGSLIWKTTLKQLHYISSQLPRPGKLSHVSCTAIMLQLKRTCVIHFYCAAPFYSY